MRSITVFFSLCWLCTPLMDSCTMRMPHNITIDEMLLQRITDSLNKDSTTSYRVQMDSTDHAALGGMLNGDRIVAIYRPDSSLLLFRSVKGAWQQIDSIRFTDYAFSLDMRDLNGDGKDELIVNGQTDLHGNQLPYVFLEDRSGTFHYRPDLCISHLRLNKKTGFVESFYEGGAFSLHSKELYKWVGDSLLLVKRAELDLTKGTVITRLFEIKNGIEVKTLEVVGGNNIFEKALFDPTY